MDNQAIVALVALVISELLPYIPIKSNGIVQLILNVFRKVFGGSSNSTGM